MWCDGADSEPSWRNIRDRLGYVRGTWSFRRCTSCGSLQLDPLPAAELLASFYPVRYDPELPSAPAATGPHGASRKGMLKSGGVTVNLTGESPVPCSGKWLRQLEQSLFFSRTHNFQARRLLQVIAAMAPDACPGDAGSGRTMLDIGCGRGLRMREFHRRGFRVEGVDFQPAAVHHVREQLKLPAYQLDVHQIGDRWPQCSFDLITAFYLLEHVHGLEPLVRSCWDLLRPGGAMVVAIPLADSCQAQLFGSRWSQVTEAPRHLSLPTQLGIQLLLARTGFRASRILPDSTLACSAMAGLSLIPNAAATYGAENPGTRAFMLRAVGAAAAAALLPWTWAEAALAKRPAAGMVVAVKPRV